MAQELITPELARRMLAQSNSTNRRVSEPRVVALARDMARGAWREDNPQNVIALDEKGNVIDGQHRLAAVVRSGKTIRMAVARKVDRAVMDVMDTGKSRTFADILSIHGYKDTGTLASAVTWCWRYEHDALTNNNVQPTHADLLDWLERNQSVENFKRPAGRVTTTIPLPRAGLTGLLYEASLIHGVKIAERFADDLATGAGLEEGDPLLALRAWTLSASKRRDKPAPRIYWAVMIKCFNAWVEGAEMRYVFWRGHGPKKEAFPSLRTAQEG